MICESVMLAHERYFLSFSKSNSLKDSQFVYAVNLPLGLDTSAPI